MAGAVHVGIVTGFGLIFHVRGVDGDATGFFFGSLVDFIVLHGLGMAAGGQHHGDGGGQGGLAVVNVADGADVYVRLIALKFFLCHGNLLRF